jgi:hypothetical protein
VEGPEGKPELGLKAKLDALSSKPLATMTSEQLDERIDARIERRFGKAGEKGSPEYAMRLMNEKLDIILKKPAPATSTTVVVAPATTTWYEDRSVYCPRAGGYVIKRFYFSR